MYETRAKRFSTINQNIGSGGGGGGGGGGSLVFGGGGSLVFGGGGRGGIYKKRGVVSFVSGGRGEGSSTDRAGGGEREVREARNTVRGACANKDKL